MTTRGTVMFNRGRVRKRVGSKIINNSGESICFQDRRSPIICERLSELIQIMLAMGYHAVRVHREFSNTSLEL